MPLTDIPADTIVQTERTIENTVQTEKPTDNIVQTEKPSDLIGQSQTISDSTKQSKSQSISDFDKQSQTTTDTTVQIEKPTDTVVSSDFVGQTNILSDSTGQSQTSSDSIRQSNTLSDSTGQSQISSYSTEQSNTPSDSIEQSQTISSSDISKNASDDFSNNNSNYLLSDISSGEIFHCLKNNNSYDDKNNIYFHLCLNYSKDKILDDLDDMIKHIDVNKTYKIIGKDFLAQVIPIDYLDGNTRNITDIFSFSYINFTECEKILRESNEYYSPRKITFVQIEINNSNNDVLVNQLEYQAYDDTKNPIDLFLCKNATVKTYFNLKNETKDEIDLISFFKKKGIDILDLNDNFFNDVCLPYSLSENDLTLNDRIKDIYKNYTFCEKNCKLVNINYEEYKAVCDCTIKENMNTSNFNFNLSNIQIEKKKNNFKIIKCHNSFTSIKDNLSNIGFWIFLGLMILNIILLFLYIYGLKTIQNYIGREMGKHGYIGKSDESHAFCHNYIKKLDKLILRLKDLKNDFIKKGAGAPPKHKRKIITLTDQIESKNSLNKKRFKIKDKESLKRDIEVLKSRMNKTKKIKKDISTTTDKIYESSLKMNHNINNKNLNE